MKKFMILLAAAGLIAATSYAQTQRTSRTKTRTHDRSEVTDDSKQLDKNQTDSLDKSKHEQDMDRNNPNKPAPANNPKQQPR